jgi:EF-P beta-lysylation protein EpmB
MTITLVNPDPEPGRQDWQAQLRESVRSGQDLLARLGLDPLDVAFSTMASDSFPVKVPAAYLARIRPGDPQDPLLLQVLASNSEMLDVPGFSRDPVGETGDANPAPGVIQKYRGRALLIASGGCAIHCRYCFRRHFPYGQNQNSRMDWAGVLSSLAADASISEVILSGGDPLVLGDQQLAELVQLIAAIPHVRRLRIHSRLPVVIPDRVTDTLLGAICDERLHTILVIHSNHANELDEAVAQALTAVRRAGISVLNQSVLLARINDSADALVALSERLFEAGALPYYLHLLDKVQGAAHFDVAEDRARQLLADVTAQLPGYLVPRLVREVEGADSKIVIAARNTT